MTDDLIKAVAARLGGFCMGEHCEGRPISCMHPEWCVYCKMPRYQDKHWLASVDAALGVWGEKPIDISYHYHSKLWWAGNLIQGRKSNESLPRAILLAFLEAPHD